MSRGDIIILKKNEITRDELFKIAISQGGALLESNTNPTIVLQKDDDVIWLYYEDDISDFSEGLISVIKEKFNYVPSSEFWIELDSSIMASQISLDFCLELSRKYDDIIIFDEFEELWTPADLTDLEVKFDASWGKKNNGVPPWDGDTD